MKLYSRLLPKFHILSRKSLMHEDLHVHRERVAFLLVVIIMMCASGKLLMKWNVCWCEICIQSL